MSDVVTSAREARTVKIVIMTCAKHSRHLGAQVVITWLASLPIQDIPNAMDHLIIIYQHVNFRPPRQLPVSIYAPILARIQHKTFWTQYHVMKTRVKSKTLWEYGVIDAVSKKTDSVAPPQHGPRCIPTLYAIMLEMKKTQGHIIHPWTWIIKELERASGKH